MSSNPSSTAPISLKQIEVSILLDIAAILECTDVFQTRARHKMYKSSKEFDLEFAKLFEKARRVHEAGSEAYGRALLLQVKPFCQSDSTAALISGTTAAVPGYHISESPERSVHIDHEFRIFESGTRQCQACPRL